MQLRRPAAAQPLQRQLCLLLLHGTASFRFFCARGSLFLRLSTLVQDRQQVVVVAGVAVLLLHGLGGRSTAGSGGGVLTSALKTADGAEAVTPGAVPAAAVPRVPRRPSAALLSKPVATTVTRISSERFSSKAVPQMMFASGCALWVMRPAAVSTSLQTDVGAGSDVDDDAVCAGDAGLQQRRGDSGLGGVLSLAGTLWRCRRPCERSRRPS